MMLLLVRPSGVRATTLRCRTCGKWLPDAEFFRNRGQPNRRGRDTQCRACDKEWRSVPGTCTVDGCEEPTRSRIARLCNAHFSEARKLDATDRYYDRFVDLDHYERYGVLGYSEEKHGPLTMETLRRLKRERILRAIQAFTRERGRPPKAKDWRKRSRVPYEFGKPSPRTWPSEATVLREYGSWNAAMEAAGVEPRPALFMALTTTCKSGRHPWVDENIYVAPNGVRACRECHREADRRYRDKRRKKKERG